MAGGRNVKLSSAIKRSNFLLLHAFHMSTSLFIPHSLYNRLYMLLSPARRLSNLITRIQEYYMYITTLSLFLALCCVSLLLVTMER